MPLVHTRNFRVRHYECDAYGHLNNANYLRYMQEAAFDASAAAGYGVLQYEQLGRLWLVRETEIEYLLPLYYNDNVAVTTWVIDFRRYTSRRAYEFHNTADGSLVARGTTNWVFLDSASGRPAVIPTELAIAYIPEGQPEALPPAERFPKAPPPPPGVFSTRRKVQLARYRPPEACQQRQLPGVRGGVRLPGGGDGGVGLFSAWSTKALPSWCARTSCITASRPCWTMSWRSPPGSRRCAARQPCAITRSGAARAGSCWWKFTPWAYGST